jgi:exodeoxyribonuclease VII large subunit
MSELINDKRVFTLSEVTRSIQRTLEGRYSSPFWVQAELVKLHPYPSSGHYYPELADRADGRITAQMRAFLGRDDYARINRQFLTVLKEPLKEGIKILLAARIAYHPLRGLSLQITDIDPAFTLGDLQRERQASLDRLAAEGLLDRNRGLALPLLPQRIAVISAQTSKGYGDFCQVTENNPEGYRLAHQLFPAILQGDHAVASLVGQLARIGRQASRFDAVVILRGGGDDTGLACYNHYRLAREIALFPLPVITGIGHAAHDTVAGRVAFHNAITPTRVAEFLLEKFRAFAQAVERAETRIRTFGQQITANAQSRLEAAVRYFQSVTGNQLQAHRHDLHQLTSALRQQAGFRSRYQQQALGHLLARLRKEGPLTCLRALDELGRQEETLGRQARVLLRQQAERTEACATSIRQMDPRQVLKRGYSITTHEGRAITSAAGLAEGTLVQTRFFEGQITSRITTSQKPATHD